MVALLTTIALSTSLESCEAINSVAATLEVPWEQTQQ